MKKHRRILKSPALTVLRDAVLKEKKAKKARAKDTVERDWKIAQTKMFDSLPDLVEKMRQPPLPKPYTSIDRAEYYLRIASLASGLGNVAFEEEMKTEALEYLKRAAGEPPRRAYE